ncbi:hypothetical protein [Streptomyces sp. NPDC018000]|uniref:hypothetical protein n=1 Tax=Streptomyces sp. NPDC018000 TaxID=3365028 RepID=UPI0037BB72C3
MPFRELRPLIHAADPTLAQEWDALGAAGLAMPLEVTYAEHTVDIPENRLLLSAVGRLLRAPGAGRASYVYRCRTGRSGCTDTSWT